MRPVRTIPMRRFHASTACRVHRSLLRQQQSNIPCPSYIQPTSSRMRFQQFHSTSSVQDGKEQPSKSSKTQATPPTHYSFFPTALPSGPPPNSPFVIDLSALKREFLQLQARAHPDMHPQADKKRAEALSARINEAYKTLQNPLLRAQYLLSLRGIEVAEDETAKVEDPDLLMEVLEAREQIEEAESEEDLVEMKETNDERIRTSEEVLEKAFKDDDIQLAKGEAVRLRYWINIKESIDGWEKGKPVVLQH